MTKTQVIKLKIARWLNSKWPERFCWADCVSWALSKRWDPFKIDKGCVHDEGPCYFGQFYNGKCWSKMTKEEQATLIAPDIKYTGQPPF